MSKIIISLSSLSLLCVALLATAPSPARASVHPIAAMAARSIEGKINVNTASTKQWELLPGVGPATAAKIVAYRSRRPFADLTHVMRVKGIGRSTYNAIKPYLTLNGETTLHVIGKTSGKSKSP